MQAALLPTPMTQDAKSSLVERISRVLLAALACLALGIAAALVFSGPAAPQREPPKVWNPHLLPEYLTEPLGKSVIRKFDAYNIARGSVDDLPTLMFNMREYLAPDFVYDSVGFGSWRSPAGWVNGEETSFGLSFTQNVFTQMLFFGDRHVATTTTYSSAFWGGPLFGIPAPKQWVTLRITDFYHIREEAAGMGRVFYNFMMIDWVDALRQIGRRMLPKPPLEEGLVLPPEANDGVPAPLSKLVQVENRDEAKARRVAEAALQQDWGSPSSAEAPSWHGNLTYFGPGGIGHAANAAAYREHVIAPFQAAFTNRTATVELSACEGNYCALFGRLAGVGKQDWLELPVAGRKVSFRFAMHYRVAGDKVQEGWTIFDFPGLFSELGLEFYALAAAGGRY